MASTTTRIWKFLKSELRLGQFPLLMGIVNVTPDSFSDGGRYLETSSAVDHALSLVDDGADILDIGGESSRPAAAAVSIDDELKRVIPVIEQLTGNVSLPISVDTTKAEVAEQSIAAGASIVNDISGLTFDVRMVDVCRDSRAGVICMHMQGTPQTMQNDPRYDDVVGEISVYLLDRLTALEQRGIPAERVVLDPGIGFGKTAEHNLAILTHISRFHELGRPILIGHSRKRFLKSLLGRSVDERNSGGIGVTIGLAAQSVDILRVHDVRATRDALLAWQAISGRPE